MFFYSFQYPHVCFSTEVQMQKLYCHVTDLFKVDCKCLLGLVSDIAWPFPHSAACLGMHSSPPVIDEWARGEEIYPQVTAWPW